jgi:mycoredoxin
MVRSIVMYTRPTCEDSARVREYLWAAGIPFREITIDADPQADAFVRSVNNGNRSTPTILIDQRDSPLVEPTIPQLRDALQQAGYPVSAEGLGHAVD